MQTGLMQEMSHTVRSEFRGKKSCSGKHGRHGMRHRNKHLLSVTENVSRKPVRRAASQKCVVESDMECAIS